jgi:hypothetical protein
MYAQRGEAKRAGNKSQQSRAQWSSIAIAIAIGPSDCVCYNQKMKLMIDVDEGRINKGE